MAPLCNPFLLVFHLTCSVLRFHRHSHNVILHVLPILFYCLTYLLPSRLENFDNLLDIDSSARNIKKKNI